jgi:hypothetical protein
MDNVKNSGLSEQKLSQKHKFSLCDTIIKNEVFTVVYAGQGCTRSILTSAAMMAKPRWERYAGWFH